MITKVKEEEDSLKKDENDILAMDELLPNTKPELFSDTQTHPYLADSVISLDLFNSVKDV